MQTIEAPRSNTKRKPEYVQVCVWPGCILGGQTIQDFENFMLKEFRVRIQYLESVQTGPDRNEDGHPVENTGGRNDILFAVHQEDIKLFAVPRLSAGIRWVEDVMSLANHSWYLYPARIKDYCSWEA